MKRSSNVFSRISETESKSLWDGKKKLSFCLLKYKSDLEMEQKRHFITTLDNTVDHAS